MFALHFIAFSLRRRCRACRGGWGVAAGVMNGERQNFNLFPPHPSTTSLASLPRVDTFPSRGRLWVCFFQKGSKKYLTQSNFLIRFFFDTQGAKKKTWQKETPFYGLCPSPQAFEKAWPKLSSVGIVRTLAARRSSEGCYLKYPRLKVFGATFFQKGSKNP